MARMLLLALTVAIAASGCIGDDDAPDPLDVAADEASPPPGANDDADVTNDTQRNAPTITRTHSIGPLRLEYQVNEDTPPITIKIEPDAIRIEWTQWHNSTAPGFHWSGIDPTTYITSGLYDGSGAARGIAVWNQTFGVTAGSDVPQDVPQNGTIRTPEAGEWTFRIDGQGHNVQATLVAVVSYGDR